ncbi:MAG TPA: lysylphosphatidylglycerol synthase transmembrane domain-containing protein [Candidatus Omnitrophota bacterium]|nr:lysylphosphatidylglycerol synthase transmembrane domain-containing protein [Candidatus Omnitrophota bacterium]
MVRVKKVISLLARLSVSCLLLVLLFKFNKIDLAVLTNDIKGADKWLLAVGFLFSIFSCILGFLRWKMLLAGAGIKASLKKLISTFSGGIFFSIFLPSTIGGDLVRVADLAQHTQKAKEVVATVFLDRLSGYIGLVLVIFPALLLGGDLISDKVVFSSVSTIILLLAVILLVLFNNSIYSRITKFFSTPGSGKIKETLKNIHREIHVFRHQKRMIVSNLLISFIIQLTLPISVYFIGLALGVRISLVYFLIFLPIIGAITLLPVAIGGLGLRESLFVVYFAKVGVVKQLALAMSLLSFSFFILYGAMGGLIYVLTVHHRRLQPNKSPCV